VFRLQNADRVGTDLWWAARHSGLSRHTTSTSRVQLASDIKPLEISHYRSKHINAVNERNVCVRHASVYDYYDCHTGLSYTKVFPKPCIPAKCSFAAHQSNSLLDVWLLIHARNALRALEINPLPICLAYLGTTSSFLVLVHTCIDTPGI
jgi:hypothetical protein